MSVTKGDPREFTQEFVDQVRAGTAPPTYTMAKSPPPPGSRLHDTVILEWHDDAHTLGVKAAWILRADLPAKEGHVYGEPMPVVAHTKDG